MSYIPSLCSSSHLKGTASLVFTFLMRAGLDKLLISAAFEFSPSGSVVNRCQDHTGEASAARRSKFIHCFYGYIIQNKIKIRIEEDTK